MRFSVLFFFFFVYQFTVLLEASVPIVLSPISSSLVNNKIFNKLFDSEILKNEDNVLEAFIDKKYHFALVRKDILETYMEQHKDRPYYVIGKLNKSMKLDFFTKSTQYKDVQDLYHKKIAVSMLANDTTVYFKKILKMYKMNYDVNFVSLDIYRAMHSLKDDNVDAIFMLVEPNIEKKFKLYMQPYPNRFLDVLKDIPALTCNQKECILEYYLIASKHVGKMVMHNIFMQLKSLWADDSSVHSSVGDYYIDVSYKKNINHIVTPIFERTPWMDFAIREAIVGKGSAENVFPMLDLSYKYIRFSKGDKGITTAPNDNKTGSWCAAYICWTLDKSGYKVHKKGRMASQSFRYFKDKLYRKINKPIFGAITLYTSMRNPKHGHVGYLFGRTKHGKNILLGGNQNNRLKFAAYPARGFGSYRFNGFYVPINYKIKPQDYLTKKDIYTSAKKLNNRYGIRKSKSSHKVR